MPALTVNKDLKGSTYESLTYKNPPLNGSNPDDYQGSLFDILELEIYAIHSF